MRGLHHFQTLIAAEDRLYVAADGTVGVVKVTPIVDALRDMPTRNR